IRYKNPVYLLEFILFIPSLIASILFCLPSLGAVIGTGLAWTIGVVTESPRSRFVMAVIIGALWASAGMWAEIGPT
ncbi:MAG: hypothetical protein NT049_17025, partial [Planctomycetota bacterium]|nr:hypothetical protein [Planctomycetota bacterium]